MKDELMKYPIEIDLDYFDARCEQHEQTSTRLYDAFLEKCAELLLMLTDEQIDDRSLYRLPSTNEALYHVEYLLKAWGITPMRLLEKDFVFTPKVENELRRIHNDILNAPTHDFDELEHHVWGDKESGASKLASHSYDAYVAWENEVDDHEQYKCEFFVEFLEGMNEFMLENEKSNNAYVVAARIALAAEREFEVFYDFMREALYEVHDSVDFKNAPLWFHPEVGIDSYVELADVKSIGMFTPMKILQSHKSQLLYAYLELKLKDESRS